MTLSVLAAGILLQGALGSLVSFVLAVAVAVLIVALWARMTDGRRRRGLFGQA